MDNKITNFLVLKTFPQQLHDILYCHRKDEMLGRSLKEETSSTTVIWWKIGDVQQMLWCQSSIGQVWIDVVKKQQDFAPSKNSVIQPNYELLVDFLFDADRQMSQRVWLMSKKVHSWMCVKSLHFMYVSPGLKT